MKPGAAIAVLLVIAVFVYAFAVNWRQYAHPGTATSTPEATVQYSSDAARISFAYPASYQVDSRIDGNAERNWPVIVLADKAAAAQVPPNSEMPPAIIVAAYPNSEGLSAEAWVKGDEHSNWKLLVDDHASTSTSVAGEPALWYHYSGLYENDAVVAAHGDTIYMFTVEWLSPQDAIRTDFNNLLKTVTFL